MVEATVVAYRVGAHQKVQEGQVLVVVEHLGHLTELPSPKTGRVEALLVHEGATVPTGTPLVRLGEVRVPKLETGGPPRTSPAVKKLAREYGIDLHALQGSGQEGRVTRGDVERVIGLQVGPKPSETPAPTFLSPGVLTITLDLGPVEAQVAREQAAAPPPPVRLTALPYVLSAIARALAEVPEVNATVFDHRLVRRSERALVLHLEAAPKAPSVVIHQADQLPVAALASAYAALSARALAGGLTSADQAGDGFGVGIAGPPMTLGIGPLRAPEVATLRLSGPERRPVVDTVQGIERVVVRSVLTAALTYDPRYLAAPTAAAFLGRIEARLRTPGP